MKPLWRILLGIVLVLVGILAAAFFGLLLLIADCTARCQANHEQLVPIVLILVGVGLAVVGVLLLIGLLGRRTGNL